MKHFLWLFLPVFIGLLKPDQSFAYEDDRSFAEPVLDQREASCDPGSHYVFSWPFLALCDFSTRGGTTQGIPVTLDRSVSEHWKALRAKDISDFERDRRAILAMAGSYRTSFDFMETVGYAPSFVPDKPYRSWGTEIVLVAEDRGDFISLQHIMVMFFQSKEGTQEGAVGPMVMKHWRQDWQYEKKNILRFQGEQTWRYDDVKRAQRKKSWSQAVYQVDDSPRYESMGVWEHNASMSTWKSGQTWRPLPRREYSVRKDYDVLEGYNRHTILPDGWVHEEENRKRVLANNESYAVYLAKEIGVNRYQRIKDFDFSQGYEYWAKTQDFWRDVRAQWQHLITEQRGIRFQTSVDGIPLFMPLFEYAETLMKESYDSQRGKVVIRDILKKYMN